MSTLSHATRNVQILAELPQYWQRCYQCAEKIPPERATHRYAICATCEADLEELAAREEQEDRWAQMDREFQEQEAERWDLCD